MRLRLGELTRGRGKIFVQVIAEGLPAGATLCVSARKADGTFIPSLLVRAPELGGGVAVVPILTCAQIVRAEVVSAAGSPLAFTERVLAPHVTQLRSRLNTLVRNRRALAMRNIDSRVHDQSVWIATTGFVADVDDVDVIHATAFAISRERGALEAPLRLAALDGVGMPIEGGIVISDDRVVPSEVDPTGLMRRISFSARIPRDACSVTLYAASDDATLGDGFACFGGRELSDMRDQWRKATVSAQVDARYEEWYLEHHRASGQTLATQRAHHFALEPTFSLIVPLYRTPIAYLEEMAASALAQTYGKLELILVNASTDDANLAAAVTDLAASDARVRVVNLPDNLGITENTNAGIAAATGDFVCFLDHDDVIEPDLLFCYVEGINAYPETDLIYCDEDKLSEDGHYFSPFFKPDWSPELLCSCNYVCHLLTVRKSIVDTLEPPTRAYDGAQDYHMTFRVAERARNVYHARRVLYHWRSHRGSTAERADSKDYTTEVGRRVVQEHLDRCGIAATVVPVDEIPNAFHLAYDTPGDPLVSVIIPNKDQPALLERCVSSILRCSTYRNFEVVIVENNSAEAETFALYERLQTNHGNVRVVTLEGMTEFNFARIVNYGVAHARGAYVVLLNNDTEVITGDWIEHLLGPLLAGGVGVTGAKLLFADDTIQHAGVAFHLSGPDHLGRYLARDSQAAFNLLNLAQDLTAVTGACLMTSRALFDKLGGLDEELTVNYNDIDYCLRVREQGLRVVYRPEAVLYHFESVSRGVDALGSFTAGGLRFCWENGVMMQRWAKYFTYGDPYMNPSLAPCPNYRQLALR